MPAALHTNDNKVSRYATRVVDDSDINDALPCKSNSSKHQKRVNQAPLTDEIIMPITVEGQRIQALLDGVANFSALSLDFCQNNNIQLNKVSGSIQLADNSFSTARLGVTDALDVWYNGKNVKYKFEVMKLARVN